jgi:hypothetical protein
MGGFGSGSWYRFGTKNLVENCLCLDIYQLNRKKMLLSPNAYSLSWSNGSNIAIKSNLGSIELSYSISCDSQHEDVAYTIPLSWTSCNYGGRRPWFICPGKGCNKRVANLYFFGKYFLCRHCHDLVYSSQRDAKAFRLLHKAQKIYKKLGVKNHDDLFITPKPKGMHQETYDRLCEEATDLELKSSRMLMMKLDKISAIQERQLSRLKMKECLK